MTAASPQPVAFSNVEQWPVPADVSGPEWDLLLLCCVDLSNRERKERIGQVIRRQLDWERFFQLAEHHGVVPRVYRHLSTVPDVILPSILDTLRQRYQTNAHRTLWLTRELLRILGHLKSRGIDALPYKGPALAEMLYGNVALRQFTDLDVLIRVADLPHVKAAVLELGYEPGITLSPREERAYLASGYEYSFDSAQGKNLLEIQWQILPRFYSVGFDVDALFERGSTISVGGQSVRTLGAEDLTLVLCVHAAKHAWVQVSWLCDIAELATSPQLDWDAIQWQARRLGIERIVAVTFLLAQKLVGTPLPPFVQARLQTDSAAASRATEILSIIERGGEYNTESTAYFRLMLRLRERRQDQFRFLWRLVFTPSVSEWSAIRLPAALFPLYRVVRFFRLMGKMNAS